MACAAYKGSSDLYIDSNVQFAIAAAKKFAAEGKKVVILVPDEPEYERSSKMFASSLELADGVEISHLTQGRTSFLKGLNFLFDAQNKIAAPEVCKEADVHIVINVTTTELADVKTYEAEVRSPARATLQAVHAKEKHRGDSLTKVLIFPKEIISYPAPYSIVISEALA